jgi:hypothetical protein
LFGKSVPIAWDDIPLNHVPESLLGVTGTSCPQSTQVPPFAHGFSAELANTLIDHRG